MGFAGLLGGLRRNLWLGRGIIIRHIIIVAVGLVISSTPGLGHMTLDGVNRDDFQCIQVDYTFNDVIIGTTTISVLAVTKHITIAIIQQFCLHHVTVVQRIKCKFDIVIVLT